MSLDANYNNMLNDYLGSKKKPKKKLKKQSAWIGMTKKDTY